MVTIRPKHGVGGTWGVTSLRVSRDLYNQLKCSFSKILAPNFVA